MRQLPAVVWGYYPGNHSVVGEFSSDVFSREALVGVGWPQTGDLEEYVRRQSSIAELVPVIREAYRHNEDIAEWPVTQQERFFRRGAGVVHRFLCEARPGDIVIFANKRDSHVYVGRFRDTDDGRYKYDGSERNPLHYHFRHFRAVEWIDRIPYARCSPNDLRQARTQSIFWRMSDCPDRFLAKI